MRTKNTPSLRPDHWTRRAPEEAWTVAKANEQRRERQEKAAPTRTDLPLARSLMQRIEPWFIGSLVVLLALVIIAQTWMSGDWIAGASVMVVYVVVVGWAWRLCRGREEAGRP